MTSATFKEHIAIEEFPTCYREHKIKSLDRKMVGCYDIIEEWKEGLSTKIRYKCNDLEVFNELVRRQDINLIKFRLTIEQDDKRI